MENSVNKITQQVANMAITTANPPPLAKASAPKAPALIRTADVVDLQYPLGLTNATNGKLDPVDCIITNCDVENWTREHHPLNEIGLPTLDTRDIAHSPSTASLEEILEHTQHYHFRTRESGFYRNDAIYPEKNGKKQL